MKRQFCFLLFVVLIGFSACKGGGGGRGKYSCKPMKDEDYNRVFSVVSGRRMEMDKLDAARQAVTNAKCMTAQQISQMVALLNMEMDKLEFAKFAFPFCADQKNYGIINNHFMMDMSKQELGKLTGVN